MNLFYQKTGAFYKGNGNCEFNVWAPLKNKVEVMIVGPKTVIHELKADKYGYWKAIVRGILPGMQYKFRLDETTERTDPASVSQPGGVHDASEIIDRDFGWSDTYWKGLPLSDLVIYELHVGTFSKEGTFEGVISKLGYLKQLGINAIELMPVAEFPGERGWGYDGVYPYATQHSYGGPIALKQLVDAAHRVGIAVILDVVYNHMGPDGNYLSDFGPYFTDRYKTPWGEALNFDGAYSDGVRNYFIQNTLMWLDEFHIDGLRMDAVHAIFDYSANHFIKQLREEVGRLEMTLGKRKFLVAEFDLNTPRYINPTEKGGYNLDGQWSDEFHHALHSVLTGETDGYYEDFGSLQHLEKAYRDTYVYDGSYSKHRHKYFGSPAERNHYSQFVVFSQNHDHIGNRALGDRLTNTLSFEQLKLAAAAVLLSPYVPLLFMGEEYGEKNPFLYFTHHQEELGNLVKEGRKKEFSYFNFKDEFPDPQSVETFDKSKLSWEHKHNDATTLLTLYKYLIEFRKTNPAMLAKDRKSMVVYPVEDRHLLAFERFYMNEHVLIILNFGTEPESFTNNSITAFHKLFDSSSIDWNGSNQVIFQDLRPGEALPINPLSANIFTKI